MKQRKKDKRKQSVCLFPFEGSLDFCSRDDYKPNSFCRGTFCPRKFFPLRHFGFHNFSAQIFVWRIVDHYYYDYYYYYATITSPDVILCGWLGLKHQLTN